MTEKVIVLVRIQLESRITLRLQDGGFIIAMCFARQWKELVKTVTARGVEESEESLAGQSEKPSMSSCPNGSTAEAAGASVGSCVLYIEDAPGSASEHRW